MGKSIKIMVAPDGEITVEANGFTGEDCVETTGPLEEALGMDPGSRELKPEYHEEAVELEING